MTTALTHQRVEWDYPIESRQDIRRALHGVETLDLVVGLRAFQEPHRMSRGLWSRCFMGRIAGHYADLDCADLSDVAVKMYGGDTFILTHAFDAIPGVLCAEAVAVLAERTVRLPGDHTGGD